MPKLPNEATTYGTRAARVVSGVAGISTRQESPDGGLRRDEIFPGGPSMSEYGIDLNWAESTSPSYSSAPVPEPRPPEGVDVPIALTTATLGAPGTAIFSGFVRDLGEYNPKLDGRTAFSTYEKMRRSDADVRAGSVACKLPIKAAEKSVVPGVDQTHQQYKYAKEIADFVRENLFGGLEYETSTGAKYSQPFHEVEDNALLMLDFGCAGHEDLWHVDGDHVRLRRMAPRLPLTFYRFHTEDDGETLLALEQYGYRKNQFVDAVVPADKLCLFTHDKEGSNYYGRSILRATYQHWYLKSQLYRIDAIALERNGLGVPTFTMPEGYSAEDKNTAANWARQLSVHENTGVVLPPGWVFEIVGIKGRLRDPWNSIRHQSEMIVKSMLAMFMNLGTTATGSRALGNTMTDFFFLSLEATAHNIASTINEGTIRRLVDYNFTPLKGKPLPYPHLVYSNIVVLNPIEISAAIKDLGNAQVDIIQPDDEIENNLRRKMALPLKSTNRPRWLPIQTRIMEAPLPGETITSLQSGYKEPGPEGEVVQPSSPGAAGAVPTSITQAALAGKDTPNPPTSGGAQGMSAGPGLEALAQENAVKAPKGPHPLAGAHVQPPPSAKPQLPTANTKLVPTKKDFREGGGIAIGGPLYKLLLSDGRGKTIGIDFDGVLSRHEDAFHKDQAGPLIPEGKQLVLDLTRKGYRIVIFTARTDHEAVRHFLITNEVPFADITNVKLPEISCYIDDRAVNFDTAKPKVAKIVKRIEKIERRQKPKGKK